MRKRIFRYLKHVGITFLLLGITIILFGLYHGASFRYAENPLMMNWNGDGPYVFAENDSTFVVNYIRGNQEQGFYLDKKEYALNSEIPASCYFPLDSTRFEFTIQNEIRIPENTTNGDFKILALSDIESGFKTFRDFLIHNRVIDKKLNWTFKNGHLVLLGDFVDRDFSATQVLWFIYKLEQEAAKKGGAPKYFHIAAILERPQISLLGENSFLGKWMASKNTIEQINGILFTHGGLHPGLANYRTNLDEINQIVRNNYYKPYYPKVKKDLEQLLISTNTGISWYRGYFKDNLKQKDVDRNLKAFHAKAIVVGHTLQSQVNRQFNGKVIGVDVKHPKDYSKSLPDKKSEGLLIEGKRFYRALYTGKTEEI